MNKRIIIKFFISWIAPLGIVLFFAYRNFERIQSLDKENKRISKDLSSYQNRRTIDSIKINLYEIIDSLRKSARKEDTVLADFLDSTKENLEIRYLNHDAVIGNIDSAFDSMSRDGDIGARDNTQKPVSTIVGIGNDDNYNPNYSDRIRIKDFIRDSCPRLFNFLEESSLNLVAQLANYNLFQDPIYSHLEFDIDYLSGEHGPAAIIKKGSSFIDGNGITHYATTIVLNEYFLRHATMEYMISVMVHKLMYVGFNLRWTQYQSQNSSIDSNYMKSHFPIFWYQTNGSVTPSLSQQQVLEVMATEYITLQQDIVRPYFNKAAPIAVRDTVLKALAYAGLQQTMVWKQLPSMGVDTCKYLGIIIAAQRSSTGDLMPVGCPGYIYNYNTDLKMGADFGDLKKWPTFYKPF
jgi:hypothetical protein